MSGGHRPRVTSPAPKVYLETPRASTGAMLSNSYDTRFGQPPRNSFSTMSSARDSIMSGRNSVIDYSSQPIRKNTYVDPTNSGGTISRTEYAIRPRRESQSSENPRRPLSLVTKNVSPSRDYPTVSGTSREVATVKSTPRDDSANRFLQPARAAHNHHRHNSATRAELDKYNLGHPRERRQKDYHRSGGPYVEKVYPSTRPAARPNDDDWSYTGPREQFARDYPSRQPRRDSLTRKERPASAIDAEFKVPWKRDAGPPPAAARQLERIEQPESGKYSRSGFDSDPERSSEAPRRRHTTRAPILHQQRDEDYSSTKDDYGARRASKARDSVYDGEVAVASGRQRDASRDIDYDRERDRPRERDREKAYRREYDHDSDRRVEKERHRERPVEREKTRERQPERDRERDRERPPRDYDSYEREPEARRPPRSRETSPERSEHSGIKGLAAATGLGGIAAAALANRKSKKDDEDSGSESRREKRHRRHHLRDTREDEPPTPNDEYEEDGHRGQRERRRRHGNESSGSDTPEDQQSSHQRRSSKRRHRRDAEEAEAEPVREPMPIVEADGLERSTAEAEYVDPVEVRRQEDGSPTTLEGRTLSPGEGEDERPRRVQLVEPVRDKSDGARPKSILKPPRAVPFPEDPNPTREGVAPLKAAGKGGIPQSARWTKINRMLVNPEALERSHERFEEREDYVVVLRVLTREEIEKFAEKTKEIRENRERAWQHQLEERRQRKASREDNYDEEAPPPHENGYEEGYQPPLAIEPAPAAPAVDLRNLQGQNAENTERVLTGNMPVPDITVENSNYSENV